MVMVRASEGNPEGGDFPTAECDAILCVLDFRDLSADQDPRIEIDVEIHSSDVADQVGKKIKRPQNKPTGGERFSLVNVQNRICEFACALGIYTTEQWKADKAAGLNRDLPLEDCVGMMFASPIRYKKWNEAKDPEYWKKELAAAQAAGDEKKAKKCEQRLAEKRGNLQIGGASGFTFWGLGDPEADHIPLDAATLAMYPNGLPTKSGQLRKRGQPATPPARQTAPPATQSTPRQATATAPAARQAPPAQKPVAAAAGMGSSFL